LEWSRRRSRADALQNAETFLLEVRGLYVVGPVKVSRDPDALSGKLGMSMAGDLLQEGQEVRRNSFLKTRITPDLLALL
jgi:hypothetical protein